MPRKMVTAFLLVFLIAGTGCSAYDYDGWVSLSIDSCGTLKIPAEWTSYEKDGFLYIVDEEKKPIMIETHSYSGPEKNDQGATETNDFYGSLTNLRILSSAVLSNGAIYGKVLMKRGELQTQNFFLELGSSRRILLIIWDDTIDENMVTKIAASFVRDSA